MHEERSMRITSYGLSMGAALAMVMSYDVNRSALWAIGHGLLSWLYVGYRVLS